MRPPGCINPPGCVSDYENPVSDCENPVSDCVVMWRIWTCCIIWLLYHLRVVIHLLWYTAWRRDVSFICWVLSLRGGVILIVEAWYNTSIYCCNDTLVFLLLYNSYAATILWYPFIYCCALVSIFILLGVGIHLYTTACLKTVHYPLRAWRLFTALVLRLVHCVLEDCSLRWY